MAFSPENFITNGLKKPQRPNLFVAEIEWPDAVGDGPDDLLNTGRFLIQSTTFPGLQMGEIQQSYFGRDIYHVGDIEFNTVSFTVLLDEEFSVRKKLETWVNSIIKPIDNISNKYNNEKSYSATLFGVLKIYEGTSNIDIDRSFNVATMASKTSEMFNVWPTNLGELTYNHESTNTIMTFDVEFRYSHYTLS